MLRYVVFFCTSCTTSNYVEISLSWCYVTRTFLDLMLRYAVFSCVSFTTSSYVKISLCWCYVTRTSLDFMLCYVAFFCVSFRTSSYVRVSLPTWKIGKETQPWLKNTWSKVNNFRNTFLFRPGNNFHVSTQWNCGIQSLKPVIPYEMEHVHKGKKHKVLQGPSKRLLGRLAKQPKTAGPLQRAWPCFLCAHRVSQR